MNIVNKGETIISTLNNCHSTNRSLRVIMVGHSVGSGANASFNSFILTSALTECFLAVKTRLGGHKSKVMVLFYL